MHSGPTSVLHVNAWQATQPSWWKAGLIDFGLIFVCYLVVLPSLHVSRRLFVRHCCHVAHLYHLLL